MENVNHAMESSNQEAVIATLTKRLADRDREISSIVQQRRNTNIVAYDTLLARYIEREEELRVAKETNGQLDKKLNESEKLVRELQNNSIQQKVKSQEDEERLIELAKVERECKSLRTARSKADNALKRKKKLIEDLNKENIELIAKSKASEKKEKKMEDEISGYQNLLVKRKSLAEEQINVLLKNEKTTGGIQGKNIELQKEVERLKDQFTKSTHAIESKDTLLNMQRQRLGEQEVVLKIYETKLQAKGRNFHQIAIHAEEGDRVWSKIEEREKKFKAKDIILSSVREENANLQIEKKTLQSEVDELTQCFELHKLQLSGTNDKVHMHWLLAQLRESVALKEKVIELEEVIRGEGYTVKAKEAESFYNEKARLMSLEISANMEKLNRIIEALEGQTLGVDDMEVPVLLGKLEECLHEFGEEGLDIDEIYIMSAASSDINESMSLNSNNNFIDGEEKMTETMCINTGDFMSTLSLGFGSLRSGCACRASAHDEDDEELGVEIDFDEKMLMDNSLASVDYESRANDDDNSLASIDEESYVGIDDDSHGRVDDDSHASADDDDDEAYATDTDEEESYKDEAPPDIHMEKVLKIVQEYEDDFSLPSLISEPLSRIDSDEYTTFTACTEVR